MTCLPVGQLGTSLPNSFRVRASIDTGPILGKVEQELDVRLPNED